MRLILLIGIMTLIVLSCKNKQFQKEETVGITDSVLTIKQDTNVFVDIEPIIKDSIKLQEEGIKYTYIDTNLFIDKYFKKSLTEIDYFNEFNDYGGCVVEFFENVTFTIGHYGKDSIHLIALEVIIKEEYEEEIDEDIIKALEIIQIENLGEDHIITFLECRKNFEFDESIIAVLKYEDVRYNKNVKKAWKADIDSLRLIEISTEGIDCLNSGHGE